MTSGPTLETRRLAAVEVTGGTAAAFPRSDAGPGLAGPPRRVGRRLTRRSTRFSPSAAPTEEGSDQLGGRCSASVTVLDTDHISVLQRGAGAGFDRTVGPGHAGLARRWWRFRSSATMSRCRTDTADISNARPAVRRRPGLRTPGPGQCVAVGSAPVLPVDAVAAATFAGLNGGLRVAAMEVLQIAAVAVVAGSDALGPATHGTSAGCRACATEHINPVTAAGLHRARPPTNQSLHLTAGAAMVICD